ncbi:MAG: DUF3761 domain-containing protein [Acidobacteria bacterium]|nr:DUF3761 domain-containing protein [Acidobacteriota bacterium]
MKTMLRLLAVATSLSFAHAALAQAPAGSTGQCKDGSYTSSASKSGACRGHQGVKEWYAASAAKSAAAAPAAPAAKPAPAPAPKAATAPAVTPAPAVAAAPAASGKMSPSARAASMTQAPGGGAGMVWVNTESKVYHCPGTTFYGKTKQGKYMSEADAKAMGAHADHNHPCTK